MTGSKNILQRIDSNYKVRAIGILITIGGPAVSFLVWITSWIVKVKTMTTYIYISAAIIWLLSFVITMLWLKEHIDIKKENKEIKKKIEAIKKENESVKKKLSIKTNDEIQLEQMRTGKPYLLVTRNG